MTSDSPSLEEGTVRRVTYTLSTQDSVCLGDSESPPNSRPGTGEEGRVPTEGVGVDEEITHLPRLWDGKNLKEIKRRVMTNVVREDLWYL